MFDIIHSLVDQASFALLYYKLHKLSITLPLHSKTLWYYAPSCLLSDFIVIAGLQMAAAYLARRPAREASPYKDGKYGDNELEELLQDVEDHISLSESDKYEAPAQQRLVHYFGHYLRKTCRTALATISLFTSFVSFTSIVAYKTEREFLNSYPRVGCH